VSNNFNYCRISRDEAAVLFVDHHCGLTALVQDYTPKALMTTYMAGKGTRSEVGP
jgi:hypothetical protein